MGQKYGTCTSSTKIAWWKKTTDDKKLFLNGGYQFPSETKDLPQYPGQVEFDVVQENVTRLQ